MAKASPVTTTMPHWSGKQIGAAFVLFLAANFVILYLANKWWPTHVVLGTHFFSPMVALLYTVLPLTILSVGFVPVVEHVMDTTEWKATDYHWLALSFVVNATALWGLTRFAEWIGMGVSSWMVVAAVAVVLTAVQGMLVMGVVKRVK